MAVSLVFTRIFFSILSTIFLVAYMAAYPSGSLGLKIIIGLALGGVFSLLLIGFDTMFRKFNLRSFNTAILGLFFGSLMGFALVFVFNALVQICALTLTLNTTVIELTKAVLLIFGTYLGTILTIRFSDELHISVPFVRFSQSVLKKRDIILDQSALTDMRLIDLCTSGILNNQLVLPRFIVKELQKQMELSDEPSRVRIRKSFETIKKLESINGLGLRYQEMDFSEMKDVSQKLLKLARITDSNILTSDTNKLQQHPISDDVLLINLHSLSSALKPLTPPGEGIQIKVQRYGKEPKQGVGYLEDGTMVVINNGGDYIGEVIDTQVISVKQTSAGRIIFTNAMVEDLHYHGSNGYEHPVYEHQTES